MEVPFVPEDIFTLGIGVLSSSKTKPEIVAVWASPKYKGRMKIRKTLPTAFKILFSEKGLLKGSSIAYIIANDHLKNTLRLLGNFIIKIIGYGPGFGFVFH